MEGKRSQKSLLQSNIRDCKTELRTYLYTYRVRPTPDTLSATHVA